MNKIKIKLIYINKKQYDGIFSLLVFKTFNL